MTDVNQEGQKTIVSFIVGLLIGGLLVWAFSGPNAEAPKEEKSEDNKEEVSTKTESISSDEVKAEIKVENPSLNIGEGKVEISSHTAGNKVDLSSATYPVAEGWIGVREYADGKLGNILGVARFSQSQGLVPTSIILQRETTAGKDYAIVVFTENGDRSFNLADDRQLDSVFTTFKAN